MQVNVKVDLEDVLLSHLGALVTKFLSIADVVAGPGKVGVVQIWLDTCYNCIVEEFFRVD